MREAVDSAAIRIHAFHTTCSLQASLATVLEAYENYRVCFVYPWHCMAQAASHFHVLALNF